MPPAMPSYPEGEGHRAPIAAIAMVTSKKGEFWWTEPPLIGKTWFLTQTLVFCETRYFTEYFSHMKLLFSGTVQPKKKGILALSTEIRSCSDGKKKVSPGQG